MVDDQKQKYTQEHEWVRLEQENVVVIGITDYAQTQLGDVVYLELPASGTLITQSQKMGEIESVKAVSEILAPVGGEVIAVNQNVIDQPGLVNQDPNGAGWLVRVKLSNLDDLNSLLDTGQYNEYVAGLTGESRQ